MKEVRPAITETAFNCPHCRALTTQYWHAAKVSYLDKENNPPLRIDDLEESERIFLANIADGESKDSFRNYLRRLHSGLPFIYEKYERYSQNLSNVDVSQCYNCKKLAIWVGSKIVWPEQNEAPHPNEDMPDEIAKDFLEAGMIATQSPRGAAALLRLCIQKLCAHLGESGKNINDDISSLVKKGLDPRVQKMLDVVRVIGNNAVHPGELDLRDNLSIVNQLFKLVNMIVDVMISQPKAIDAMYDDLSPGARGAIEKRDK